MMKKKKIWVLLSIPLLFTALISLLLRVFTSAENNNGSCSSGGCSGCNGCRALSNNITIDSTYYKDKQTKLLKDLSSKVNVFKNVMKANQNEDEINTIVEETKKEFIEILPSIPYIGGDNNPMTEDIEQAAMVLAFYRVEKRHGKTVEEVGSTICQAIEREFQKYPKWLLRISSAKYFTKSYIKQLMDNAEASRERQYPGNWVYGEVVTDDSSFDYGYNFTECAIVKYFNEQNVSELTPHLCKLDFINSNYLDEGLIRTTTLAEGGPYCDFRYERVENSKLDILTYSIIGLIGVLIFVLLAFFIRFITRKIKQRKLHKFEKTYK